MLLLHEVRCLTNLALTASIPQFSGWDGCCPECENNVRVGSMSDLGYRTRQGAKLHSYRFRSSVERVSDTSSARSNPGRVVQATCRRALCGLPTDITLCPNVLNPASTPYFRALSHGRAAQPGNDFAHRVDARDDFSSGSRRPALFAREPIQKISSSSCAWI